MHKIRDLTSLSLCLLVLSFGALQTNSQRVVPGVNPQHYQQVPVQQQQYHAPPAPQQYQQQPHLAPGVNPQQFQQVPQQQQQYQQQHQQQQVPLHQQAAPQHQQQVHQQAPQGHVQQQQHHGHNGQPQQVLHAGNMDHERAHIQEHMQVPIDTSKMSEAELQFHYFKMHDSDNNNKLDGCELIKSLIHWHEQGNKEQQHNEPNHENKPHVEEKVFSDEELVALIDPILQMDDTSRDGYIDYPEFIKAQQKAQSKTQQEKQQAGGH